MAVFENSRYINTGVFVKNETHLFLKMRNRPAYNEEFATYYTWVQGDTLDGVAYTHYGNAHLWWAIMDANSQYQIETEIMPGDVLKIPSLNEIIELVR